MNKHKITLLAALALGSLLAFTSSTSAQDNNGKRRAPTAQQRVERMSTELNLTEDQKTKVTALFEEEGKKMRDLRADTNLSQDERREKGRAMREETDKKLKGILKPDQYEKWQKTRDEMRKSRGQNGEKKDSGKKAE